MCLLCCAHQSHCSWSTNCSSPSSLTNQRQSTKLEKQIELSDLPEVVVCILCMTPGFNSSYLNHHGYQSGSYYRGVLQPTKLIGDFVVWNWGTQEKKSSDRILEEALLLPKSEEIYAFAIYTDDCTKFEKAEVTYIEPKVIVLVVVCSSALLWFMLSFIVFLCYSTIHT